MWHRVRVCLVALNLMPRGYSAANSFLHAYCLGNPTLRERVDIVRVDACVHDDQVAIAADIAKCQPDVVAFSTLHGNSQSVRDIMLTVRSLVPEARLLVGGMDASNMPGLFLGPELPDTIVVYGEGEATWGELLCWLLDGDATRAELRDIPGISYFEDGQAVNTAGRMPVADLDVFPSPILTGAVDLERHRGLVQLETYRGCPFTCAFCHEGRGFSRIRKFSMDRVQEELLLILQRKARLLRFFDSTFNFDTGRTAEVLEFLARHNRGTECHAEMKLELLTPELIQMLPAAGFREIELGLQTVSRRVLDRHDRTWDRETFEENLERLKRVGITPTLHVMAGLPGDRMEGVLETLDYVEEKGANSILFHTRVIGSTTMAQRPQRDGCITAHDGTERVVQNSDFSAEDFRQIGLLGRAHGLVRQCLNNVAMRRQLFTLLDITYSGFLEELALWLDEQGLGRGTRYCPEFCAPDELDPRAIDVMRRFVNAYQDRRRNWSSDVEVILQWAAFEHLGRQVMDLDVEVAPGPAIDERQLPSAVYPRLAEGVHVARFEYDIRPLLSGQDISEARQDPWRGLLFLQDGQFRVLEVDEPVVELLRICDGSRAAGDVLTEWGRRCGLLKQGMRGLAKFMKLGIVIDVRQSVDAESLCHAND